MLGRRLVIGLLVCLNLLLLVRLFWSGQSVFSYLELRGRYERLEEMNVDAEKRSVQLSREITRLREDSSYQERVVRDRMNYLRKGEILYIFPEGSETTPGVVADEEKN